MRKCSASGFLVLGALACVSTATLAETVVVQTLFHYDVGGATPQDVRVYLNRHGPFDAQGRRFDGYTRWYVRWRYLYKSVPEGCAIASVVTSADIAITLPRLGADSQASDELKKSFADYVEKLRVHEEGHAQTAIDTAKRIDDGIAALPPEATCERLGQVANELGYALIKEANQADLDYDARTQHGRTQGVQFP
jgi:predicted secreted Zn-dependent protease